MVLVGLGAFGANHLRVLRQLAKEKVCTIGGVVDVRRESLTRDAVAGLRVETSLDSLLDECDTIDVVTPTETHYEIAKKCLKAEKDVLVEKPLALTSDEAGELTALAEENKRVLAAGQIFRYHPCVSEIKSIITQGKLGQVGLIDGRYMGTRGPRRDSGVLFNLAIHLVDLYSYLLNERPKEVTAHCHRFSSASQFEDYAALTLKYPSGAVGQTTVSWLNPHKLRDIIMAGRECALAADFEKNRILLSEKLSPLGVPTEIKGPEPLALELADFIECVRERRKPISDANSAVIAIRTIEQAYNSSKLGKTIAVD